MILALLLAHLIGDYILQWDKLSHWKSEKIGGVLVHGTIVTLVTLVISLLFDTTWWPWAIFIGISHTVIDGIELPIRLRLKRNRQGLSPLFLFLIDQILHLAIIVLSLELSGALDDQIHPLGLVNASNNHSLLTIMLAYTFLTMPAYIIIRFLVYGLLNGSAPDFTIKPESKYLGMFERGGIATLILLGQYILIPLVTFPRLVHDWSNSLPADVDGSISSYRGGRLYLAELLSSMILAVAIGIILRQLL